MPELDVVLQRQRTLAGSGCCAYIHTDIHTDRHSSSASFLLLAVSLLGAEITPTVLVHLFSSVLGGLQTAKKKHPEAAAANTLQI